MRWDRSGRWVPAGDAGMTGARRAGAGVGRGGVCSVGWVNVFSFGGDVSSFWPNVFNFEGNVSTLAGDVSSFGGAPWLGMGRGRKARFLGSAALRSE